MSDTGVWVGNQVFQDPMEAHRLWNNAHTATLEDYRLNGDMLYHLEVIHAKVW